LRLACERREGFGNIAEAKIPGIVARNWPYLPSKLPTMTMRRQA
jgi:hypothetical protein